MASSCEHVFTFERIVKWWQECYFCKHKYMFSKNLAECKVCHVLVHNNCLQKADGFEMDEILSRSDGKPSSAIIAGKQEQQKVVCGVVGPPSANAGDCATTSDKKNEEDGRKGTRRVQAENANDRPSIIKKFPGNKTTGNDGCAAAAKRRVTFAPFASFVTFVPFAPVAETRTLQRRGGCGRLPVVFERPADKANDRPSILKKNPGDKTTGNDGGAAAAKRRVTFAPFASFVTFVPFAPVAETQTPQRRGGCGRIPVVFEMPADNAAAAAAVLPVMAEFEGRVSDGDARTYDVLNGSGRLQRQQAPRQARRRRQRRQQPTAATSRSEGAAEHVRRTGDGASIDPPPQPRLVFYSRNQTR